MVRSYLWNVTGIYQPRRDIFVENEQRMGKHHFHIFMSSSYNFMGQNFVKYTHWR